MRRVQIGPVSIGGGQPLAFVAGPCVIESAQHTLDTASAIRDIARRCGVPVIFKASYDKANRTARASFRGPGLDSGLKILADVRSRTGLPSRPNRWGSMRAKTSDPPGTHDQR